MSASVIAGVPLTQFAAVTAALAEGFPLRAVLSIEEIDAARWAEADRGWTQQLDGDTTLRTQYESEVSAAQSRLLTREDRPPEDGAARRAGKARLVRSQTGGAPAAAEAPRFLHAAAAPVAVVYAPHPEPRPPPPDDESTKVGYEVAAPVLPFQALSDDDIELVDDDNLASTGDFRQAAHHGADALPFRAPPPGEESPHLAAKLPTALPFREAPSTEYQHALARPAATEGAGSDGSTVAVRDADGLRKLRQLEGPAVPWDAKPPPAAPAPPAAPPPPVMSLERHASLCLEIAVDPARTAEALARYQVSAADKARADEYYQARCAVDPDLYAQWNHAYTVYHAWFTRPDPNQRAFLKLLEAALRKRPRGPLPPDTSVPYGARPRRTRGLQRC